MRKGEPCFAEYTELQFEDGLPYSLEAEQSVLGGILVNPDCLTSVLEILTRSDMFYRKQHAEIYDIFLSMFNLSKPIDFITVLDEVAQAQIFQDDASAKVYLAQLMEMVPSTANIADYCNIVLNRYYRRRLITAAKEIEEYARNEEGSANYLMDMAEQKLYDIR